MLSFRQFITEKAMYAILKHNDLTKRGGTRLDVFIEKIKDGEEFLTTKGAVIIDKSILPELEANFKSAGYKVTMKGSSKGKAVSLKYPQDFYKTPEFGGKGVGFGTQAEDRQLALLRKEMERVMEKEGVSVLKMRVGKRLVDVVGVESTPGTPKSDFHLVGPKGEEVAWISHKDGTKASQFQQYGGLTKDWSKLYSGNKDIQKFIDDVKEMRPDGLKRGDSIWRFVKDKKVIQYTVWGPDYGSRPGRDNVDEFHQGTMKLKKSGQAWEITSVHKDTNGGIPKKASSGDYTAIYVARYTSDRGFPKGGGLPNARVGVFARDYVSGKAEQI